jgi:hypothetical protein
MPFLKTDDWPLTAGFIRVTGCGPVWNDQQSAMNEPLAKCFYVEVLEFSGSGCIGLIALLQEARM